MRPPEYATLERLREDALARGMLDLAIVYGWSMLRIMDEVIARQLAGQRDPPFAWS
jgi:hypothetical protein